MKRECSKCRHYRPSHLGSSDLGKCVAPQIYNIKVKLIKNLPWQYAMLLRVHNWFDAWRWGFCGQRGRWWQPIVHYENSQSQANRNDFGFPMTSQDDSPKL